MAGGHQSWADRMRWCSVHWNRPVQVMIRPRCEEHCLPVSHGGSAPLIGFKKAGRILPRKKILLCSQAKDMQR